MPRTHLPAGASRNPACSRASRKGSRFSYGTWGISTPWRVVRWTCPDAKRWASSAIVFRCEVSMRPPTTLIRTLNKPSAFSAIIARSLRAFSSAAEREVIGNQFPLAYYFFHEEHEDHEGIFDSLRVLRDSVVLCRWMCAGIWRDQRSR